MFSSNTSQVSNDATYIEDVFSTYLTTGTGVSNTQTVNNGIDLLGKGGLVWGKRRNGADDHILVDTARGVNTTLSSNNTGAQITSFPTVSSFLSNGFTATNYVNSLSDTFAFWTFRKQPKFFDVVTYVGDGTSNRPVAHSLASVPGCIIIKSVGTTTNWMVWHKDLTPNYLLTLNSTAAQANYATVTIHDVTSTNFQVDNYAMLNASGVTYVAYVFAHNAGGFGLTGTDNVISCGSFVGTGGISDINLGYEPQWLLFKNASTGGTNWTMMDNMRGWGVASSTTQYLYPNLSNAETNANYPKPTATGFQHAITSGDTCIYIAIRRGPMKVPTDGTKVFLPTTYASPGLNVQSTVTTNFPIDLNICGARGANSGYIYKFWFTDRLRVSSGTSTSNSLLTAGGGGTAAETAYNGLATFYFDRMTSYQITDSNGSFNGYSAGALTFGYDLRRAPGFFDEVCYTGNSTNNRALTHNLTVTPSLIIYKRRNIAADWVVMSTMFPNASDAMFLQSTDAIVSGAYSSVPRPTSTSFYVGDWGALNNSGDTYVAYLFASCPGVSKVGSFTGNGSSQTINCGFTGGARFVMIKRTDSTGQWYVWDSARGIVPGNDPYLSFSNSQSEDFNGASDSVDADATGFIVNQDTVTNSNVNGATYIYLAIA